MPAPRNTGPEEVEQYLRSVPPEFRSLLRKLRATILRAAPGSEEVISYRMPAVRQHGMLVYYGAFTDHCSLFVGSTVTLRQFREETREFGTGKGTLHFTPDHPLPDRLVVRLVRARLAENRRRKVRRN